MTNQEYIEFAKGYTERQYDQIKFDWNGKHGDEFIDNNYQFRMHLCEVIKDDLSVVPDQLIIDLYLELAKSAKETFGVYNSFHLFANELLKRGGVKYFDLYVEGASKSMDTGIMSGRLDLNKELYEEIFNHINQRLKETPAPRGYDYMKQRFEWLAKN